MNLDNPRDISKLDRDNMLELLSFFSKQCMDGLFIGEHTSIDKAYMKKYENIIFTGLGGSAIGADTIKDLLAEEIKIPIFVNRNYSMPAFAGEKTLVFAVSYSGNTEETLSAYTDAIKKHTNIIVITSGGKLQELASKNKNMVITIPKGYPPRCALGYSFIPALMILCKMGLIKTKKNEIKEAAALMSAM
ncbi:MAG: SIS domain-containing protein, partial [Candidatus Omnitrophota bacterium]